MKIKKVSSTGGLTKRDAALVSKLRPRIPKCEKCGQNLQYSLELRYNTCRECLKKK